MDLENEVPEGQDEAGPTMRILVRRTTVETVIVEVLGDEFEDYTMSAAEVVAEELDDDSEWNIIDRQYEAIREAREDEVV